MPKKSSTREAGIKKLFKLGVIARDPALIPERTQRKIVRRFADVLSGKAKVVKATDTQAKALRKLGKSVSSSRGVVAANVIALPKSSTVKADGTLISRAVGGTTTYKGVKVNNEDDDGGYQDQIRRIAKSLPPGSYMTVSLPGGAKGSSLAYSPGQVELLIDLIYQYVQQGFIEMGDTIIILQMSNKAANKVSSNSQSVNKAIAPLISAGPMNKVKARVQRAKMKLRATP